MTDPTLLYGWHMIARLAVRNRTVMTAIAARADLIMVYRQRFPCTTRYVAGTALCRC